MVSFGKKSREEVTPEATLGSIPVPPAENALVIDLPEGQKLVLGKMEDGTVIEVATWRGTGRPDSRTNRLMLGVSSGLGSPASSDEAVRSEAKLTLATQIRTNLMLSASRVARHARIIFRKIFLLASRKLLKKSASASSKSSLIDATEMRSSKAEDFEFDKWLEEFSAQSNEISKVSETKKVRRASRSSRNLKPGRSRGQKPTTRSQKE